MHQTQKRVNHFQPGVGIQPAALSAALAAIALAIHSAGLNIAMYLKQRWNAKVLAQ